MRAVLIHALGRLRTRPGRALLAAGGIFAAAAMLGAGTTVAYSLATGFDRAADAADLADVVARFEPLSLSSVQARTHALPNVESVSFRLELAGTHIHIGERWNGHAKLQGVRDGRRGYAIVAGRDLSGAPLEIVVERGLAREWGLGPGSFLEAGLTVFRVVGVAVTPDTVAFPLANGPRLYAPYETVRELAAAAPGTVNLALLWASDPARLDVTLAQARAASFGVEQLRFVTRDGIETLLGQAAGIVIALLVAFSLVALATAGLMLAASSAAEVQRRLSAIGLLRTVGASPRQVTAAYALEAALVAAPAGALGLAAGTLLVTGPSTRLLEALNELSPGASLLAPLALCLVGIVSVVAGAAALPTWRAASRPALASLAGADLVGTSRRSPLPAGTLGLGLRLAVSRPLRTAGTAIVLASSVSVILLMLALASLLGRLQSDPETVGKRYRIEVSAPPAVANELRRLPGVAGAQPRFEVQVADSFSLGQSFSVIAFGGEHTRYEAPPLVAGRRIRSDDEVEVGVGLADALSLSPGSTLAVLVPSGRELRFRVAGTVSALQDEGRVAYVRPARLLAAEPFLSSTIAVLLDPGASREAVEGEILQAGYYPAPVRGATVRDRGFLRVLAALLQTVALVNGLVCLYVLVQMLALTAQERRRALGIVRALGGSRWQVTRLLAGGALAVAALASVGGFALQRFVVAPAAADLAASYVSLPLQASAMQALLVAAALVVLAFAASTWVARGVAREPVVRALSAE